jgi:hypothetical protein
MKSLAFCLFFFSAAVFAQSPVPSATVLPAQLGSSLNSQKSKPGQRVTARIMQDVPVSTGKKIPAGAKVIGQVVNVSIRPGGPSEITLRFNKLQFHHQLLAISTSLRAVASMMEVEAVQIPPAGTDRGTPWAWSTRNLIGDEVAYGEGGPVARGDEIVGHSLFGGVLTTVRANRDRGCRGEFAGQTAPQAFWVFSSDACGVYGIPDVEVTHAGRTSPLGEITLTSEHGNVEIRSGSGVLLRVN